MAEQARPRGGPACERAPRPSGVPGQGGGGVELGGGQVGGVDGGGPSGHDRGASGGGATHDQPAVLVGGAQVSVVTGGVDEQAGHLVAEGGDRVGPRSRAAFEGDDEVGHVRAVPGRGGVHRAAAAQVDQRPLVHTATDDDDVGGDAGRVQGADDLVQPVTGGVHRDDPGPGHPGDQGTGGGALGPHLDRAGDAATGLGEAGTQGEDGVAGLLLVR